MSNAITKCSLDQTAKPQCLQMFVSMTMRYAHHYPESLRHGVDVLDTLGAQKRAQSMKKGYSKLL